MSAKNRGAPFFFCVQVMLHKNGGLPGTEGMLEEVTSLYYLDSYLRI